MRRVPPPPTTHGERKSVVLLHHGKEGREREANLGLNHVPAYEISQAQACGELVVFDDRGIAHHLGAEIG